MRELDADGKVTRLGNYTAEGALRSYTTYTYDAAGRQNRTGFYNATGTLMRYEVHAYDDDGRQIHLGFYNASGILSSFEAYDYDDRGRRDYRGFYNATANLTRYEIHIYDASADSAPSRIDFYNATDNLTGYEIRSYMPDMQINHTGFYDAAGDLMRYRIYNYDARGQLTYLALYTAGHVLRGYDSYGYGDVSPPQAQPPEPAMAERPAMRDPQRPDRISPIPIRSPVARPPATDTRPPPRPTAPPRPIRDQDGDRRADVVDNCPNQANPNQADMDRDGIGNACEAQAVAGLIALADGSMAVNLSWVNPAGANLIALNVSYRRQDGMGRQMAFALPREVNLTAGTLVVYRVAGLSNGTAYTLSVGGIDFRHGRVRQFLPLASINVTTPAGRGTPPAVVDRCPLTEESDLEDFDNDGIGDDCEAVSVTGLSATPDPRNATVMILRWTNPVGGVLRGLNVSYARQGSGEMPRTIEIGGGRVPLAAERGVSYQVMNLASNTTYDFTVSGLDLRHGRLPQSLPPAFTSARTAPDQDSDQIADAQDNCLLVANSGQEDRNGIRDDDDIGDVCEARPVTSLNATADPRNATIVTLQWTNPAGSDLSALNVSYVRQGSAARPTIAHLTGDLVSLNGGVVVTYPVMHLEGGTTYQFTVSGLDLRYASVPQSLPPRSILASTRPDQDGDQIPDDLDNCPLISNPGQEGPSHPGIGDACPAMPVTNLTAEADSPTSVILRWKNPTRGLTRLQLSRSPGPLILLFCTVSCEALADVEYTVTGLSKNTSYIFTVGGGDRRGSGQTGQNLPPANITVMTPPDRDDDNIRDERDNCPAVSNPNQAPSDVPGIGAACRAGPVTSLTAVQAGFDAVNLSWVNPAGSNLQALNISYTRQGGAGGTTVLDITSAVDLTASAAVTYQVRDLSSGTSYTFTLGGIDLRYGRNQTLPLARIDRSTRPDQDNDGFLDNLDNCPTLPNRDQAPSDVPGIGAACRAGPVTDLTAVQESATTVNLNWVNPPGSSLTALSVSYARRDDAGDTITLDLTSAVSLTAGAAVAYRVESLARATNYTFTVGGMDLRQGRISQSLPPVSVNVSLLLLDRDGDGIPDGQDNCISEPNQEQTDANNDNYGDLCSSDQDGDGFIDIQTPEQLNAIRNAPNDAVGQSHELLTDIDLSGYPNWDPIMQYNGTLFEGNDYTIRNLNISTSGNNPAGLFASVSSQTTFRNLRIRALRIRGGRPIGVLAAVSEANISNSHVIVEGSVSGTESGSNCINEFVVGGLVGHARAGAIVNSSATVLDGISFTYDSGGCASRILNPSAVGGLAGHFMGGRIENSFSIIRGSLSATDGTTRTTSLTGHVYAGGLVGQIVGGADINRSYARVEGDVAATGSIPQAGGLVGSTAAGSVIANSYAIVGGGVSVAKGPSYLSSEVYSLYVGGFVGQPGDRIVNSYTVVNGTVSARVIESPFHRTSISIGPLVGTTTTVTHSYHDVMNVNSQSVTSGGDARSPAQLRCPTEPGQNCPVADPATTYTGWDETIWDFGDAQTLPTLRSIRPSPLR